MFSHPTERGRAIAWTGASFDLNGRMTRVLAYDVESSGWTDALTELHEETGGSDHFIDVASRRYAIEEAIRCAGRPGSVVMEIGVSSGFLLRELIERLPDHVVIGADYTRGTLDTLAPKVPGVPLLQFDLSRCPLPDSCADVIVLLNVLEHIDDHAAAVRHLFRIVRPGGAVIIEVPAGSSLYDVYDKVLMHYRRYDMLALVDFLQRAGFVVERRSHLGFVFYPLFYIAKRFNQFWYSRQPHPSEQELVAMMISSSRNSSGVMGRLMNWESALRRRFYLPWGVRCLVTCRRPA